MIMPANEAEVSEGKIPVESVEEKKEPAKHNNDSMDG